MHTYDADRHTWRYDVGGYAWDNSELSPDLWLWYQYLRTGRADVFRFAEAMTRHTGEVDVYHLGRWAGLGTRHNVQHWGCSAKQLRISNADLPALLLLPDRRRAHRRPDGRAGRRSTRRSWCRPTRKVRPGRLHPRPPPWRSGSAPTGARSRRPGSPVGAHGDERARDGCSGTMADIGALPHGFLTGEARLDLATGGSTPSRDQIAVSHLSSVFGLPEICSELIALDLRRTRVRAGVAGLLPALPGLRPSSRPPRWAGRSAASRWCRRTAGSPRTPRPARATPTWPDLAWRKFFLDEGDQLNRNPMQRQTEWRTTAIDGALMPVDEARSSAPTTRRSTRWQRSRTCP